ncbi:MAG: DUF4388 domain-containing protein [Acidobacteriota bacterium]
MAIFGHLSDLPFPEIFNCIGQRTGHLTLSGIDGVEPLRLHLRFGRLCGLQIRDGVVIDDSLIIRDRLVVLMDADTGGFEFHRCPEESIRGTLDLPIAGLLMSIASAVDEITAYRHRFAHPETRFEAVANPEPWLDEDLYHFFEQARPLLVAGASAKQLAEHLALSADQIQLFLYKLRSFGKIAPRRAFDASQAAARPIPARPIPAPVVKAPIPAANVSIASTTPAVAMMLDSGRGLVRRLLKALGRRALTV